jgi:hypothetical protein
MYFLLDKKVNDKSAPDLWPDPETITISERSYLEVKHVTFDQ